MNTATTKRAGGELAGFPAGVTLVLDRAELIGWATDASRRRGAVPLAIARPVSADEVQQVIQWANLTGVPLVPASSAEGPRRRGDTVCSRPALILDLSRLDRIIHVDGRDAIAVIEPGVSFAAFDKALRPHGLRSFRPLLARPAKSVIAAFLEREPITVPGQHWDSADPLGATEFVFGTGKPYRTGGGAFPGTLEENLAAGNRQMLGVGPAHTDFARVLQGSQGALGVVTWASIYCQRLPARELPLLASADRLAPVVELAYRLLRRRPAGQLFLMNGRQLALLCANDVAHYRALAAMLPRWLLYFELCAPDYFPDESIAYQLAAVECDAAELNADLAREVSGIPAHHLAVRFKALDDQPGRNLGLASEEVFCLSQLDRVEGLLERVTGAIADEPCIYLQPLVHGVNAHCQLTLLAPVNEATALSAQAVGVAETLAAAGGFFSRPYYPWAHVPFERDRTIVALLAKSKSIFDPQTVLQPGAQSLGGLL
ncbi:conserved protein of unknown function [Pseudomonas sp. JV551A1]|uniref:FAD-binding PCMH-type domain-containing protein n=1 Tax=Pseudomonas inefficax TaxID=2078786 RepID=A0AAQ1PD30_9PSED|nr:MULTISPECIES: FAD-binding oxidoreductase [Pseudomonas]SPO54643.1 conserved protein of unknown function [Pseudomonas sp. JV551A1]SPO62077.1 conserved protein of unknown function [Pseudomonas inefficax]